MKIAVHHLNIDELQAILGDQRTRSILESVQATVAMTDVEDDKRLRSPTGPRPRSPTPPHPTPSAHGKSSRPLHDGPATAYTSSAFTAKHVGIGSAQGWNCCAMGLLSPDPSKTPSS
jgi:hypothetical protein